MSQNWVCSNCPPGALKQQVSATAVVFWQLSCGLGHDAGEPARTVVLANRAAGTKDVMACRMLGYEDMSKKSKLPGVDNESCERRALPYLYRWSAMENKGAMTRVEVSYRGV